MINREKHRPSVHSSMTSQLGVALEVSLVPLVQVEILLVTSQTGRLEGECVLVCKSPFSLRRVAPRMLVEGPCQMLRECVQSLQIRERPW
jgi:hypothetical protein